MGQHGDGIAIYYDGECPFCSNYVRLLRLRKEVGRVTLVDLRSAVEARRRLRADGFDVDDGMVVEFDGRLHHGDDAVHVLATLSSPAGPIGWLNKRLFRSLNRSQRLYPYMRAGRNATLKLLGRNKLRDLA